MKPRECRMDVFRELLEELLEKGSSATFRVSGMSMHPTIKDGDVITVEAAMSPDVRRGDIVAFRLGQKLCVHRVVRIRRRGARGHASILTAGDGLNGPDAPIDGQVLLGRVVEVRTGGGTWRPDDPAKRVLGLARASLGLHPRLHLALYNARRILFGRTGGSRGAVGGAGCDT